MESVIRIVVVVIVVTMVLGMLATVFGPGFLRAREERRVLAGGTTARAVVLALEDTGNRFNDAPEIVIRLRVSAPGRPDWTASVHRILSGPEALSFTPGRELAVRYDPARPDRIALEP
jgi:type II secretory pathway pseudopilin PulG